MIVFIFNFDLYILEVFTYHTGIDLLGYKLFFDGFSFNLLWFWLIFL
jgi:hypothetical protein